MQRHTCGWVYRNLVLFRTLFKIWYAAVRTRIKHMNIFQQRDFHTHTLRCEFVHCSLLLPSSFSQPSCQHPYQPSSTRVPLSLSIQEQHSDLARYWSLGHMRGRLLLQPATLLGTHGNLAHNIPFYTHIAVSVSVALHTCVRRDNVLKKNALNNFCTLGSIRN